jgi:acetyl-CoA C-acetyltransferase
MLHKAISVETYRRSAIIADPINLYDSSPISDGSAAVILAPLDMAKDLTKNAPIRILASATATDSLDLAGRVNMLDLAAARLSARKAYEKSGLSPDDIDVFEVHDAFSIMAALSLEAAGFADPGKGVDLAQNGDITIQGRVPISTMGGLKGRGHPVGATGVYELVDLITQLRGDAGENQVSNATIGMTQNIGGTGATVVTHILSRD